MHLLLNRLCRTVSLLVGCMIVMLFSGGWGGDAWVLIIVAGGLLGRVFKELVFPTHVLQTLAQTMSDVVVAPIQTKQTSEAVPHEPIDSYETIPSYEVIPPHTPPQHTTPQHAIPVAVHTPVVTHTSPHHTPNPVRGFFATNTLEKIGGLLLFLGVIFLLGLIYTVIGPVGKLLIGFGIGITCYGVGIWIHRRGYISQGFVLLGTGLLINNAVILGGRYLLGTEDVMILSSLAAFGLLIVNTIIAIITSLAYSHKTLLMFAFVFAYLNPFLIGFGTDDGTILIGYAMVISIGAYILASIMTSKTKKSELTDFLSMAGLIGGMIVVLVAPFGTEIAATLFVRKIKLVSLLVLGLVPLGIAYREGNYRLLGLLFGFGYLGMLVLMSSGMNGVQIDSFASASSSTNFYLMFGYHSGYLLILWLINILAYKRSGDTSLLWLFFSPLVVMMIAFFLYGSYGLLDISTIVPVMVILYLFSSFSLFDTDQLPADFGYIVFGVLGAFSIISNRYFPLQIISSAPRGVAIPLSLTHTIGLAISSMVYLLISYYFSYKPKLGYLYTIGTIGTILTMAPVIATVGHDTGELIVRGCIAVFWLLHTSVPLRHITLITDHFTSFVSSYVAGGLFFGIVLWHYGTVYFPGVSLGRVYLGLAVVYGLVGALRYLSHSVTTKTMFPHLVNTLLTMTGVSMSFLALSVVFLFASQPEVIGMIWLVQATVMFFMAQQTRLVSLYTMGLALFIMGMIKTMALIPVVHGYSASTLIIIAVIVVTLAINLWSARRMDTLTQTWTHDIIHLGVMCVVMTLLYQIVPHTGTGLSLFAMSIGISLMCLLYSRRGSPLLRTALVLGLIGLTAYHSQQITTIFDTVLTRGLPARYDLIQYATTAIIGLSIIGYRKNTTDASRIRLKNITILYVCLSTTLYVYHIIPNIFIITAYRFLSGFILILTGIMTQSRARRTLGLYLLFLSLGKVLLYDVWMNVDGSIMRVVVLMGTGALMIFLSSLYQRHGGNIAQDIVRREESGME